MTATVTPAGTPTLTASDRCDRCSAQARVRVLLASGELLFCAHHAKAYEPTLRPSALEWHDETHLVSA